MANHFSILALRTPRTVWKSLCQFTYAKARLYKNDSDGHNNSGIFPGGGNVYSLQYACLKNPMDRGVWLAIQSIASQRDGHSWSDLAHTYAWSRLGLKRTLQHEVGTGPCLGTEEKMISWLRFLDWPGRGIVCSWVGLTHSCSCLMLWTLKGQGGTIRS